MAVDSDDALEIASDEEIEEVTSGSSSDADEEAYWLDSTEGSDVSSESCELLDFNQPSPRIHKLEAVSPVEHSELLQNCLDYCSHTWPSPEGHESLLHSMLGLNSGYSAPRGFVPSSLKNPADLSSLPFSDGSDPESTKDTAASCFDVNSTLTPGQLGLRPSALNPQLTSKHAKKVHMQRLVHQEIERKRLEESGSWPGGGGRRRQAEALLPLLEDLGYTLDDVEALLESCSDDAHKVQLEVDALLESSKNKTHSWLTSVPRRRQRESGLRELRKQELGVLKSKFGTVMRELEDREDRIPEQVPESARQQVWSDLTGDCREERPETVTAAAKMDGMPEVSSIKHMSRGDCRKLLRQLKSLVHAPAVLYKALAARAMDEYARVKPSTFQDCRQVTFWQFAGSERSGCGPDCYAGKQFFDFLNDSEDKASFRARLPDIHPMAAVYMLQTMMESNNVVNFIFQEVARYVAERITSLDRDGLGRLVYVFAKAGIKNPGLFSVVKQECIRRSKLKEGNLSLSPKVITDVVVAFATAKILDDDLFEVLMLREVSLMDCPLRQELVPDVCAPVTSSSGNKLPAVAFSLQDLVLVCKAFVDLRKVDREFFEDVANYACRAFASPDVTLCEWFVGNPNVTLPQIASIFAKAEVLQLDSLDFFAQLKTMMMRRKDDLRPHSLKKFQHAWHMHKSRQEKQERQRSQPPQRRRGAMGRAYVEDKPAVQHQSRTEKARQQRQRLAAMTEEEVLKEIEEEEKHAGTSASAKLLLSGFKVEALLEAQEGPKEGKKTKSEIMEASTSISIRSMVKGKKARNEEVSASAKAEARKHARGRR